MFQPIDPIEQRKQALIQHLVGRAGMAGGGRPVGTMSGRPFGSFTRSGFDPLLRILAQHGGENFQGINPGQMAAAAALANAPGMSQPAPPPMGGGMPSQGTPGGAGGLPAGAGGPSISPGEFYGGGPTFTFQPSIPPMGQTTDPFLASALSRYGGYGNGMGWG